jgi:hypothetical protein
LTSELTDLTYNEFEYICYNMRDVDRVEIMALQEHENMLRFAYEAHAVIRNGGRAKIGWYKGKPCAVGYFRELRKGVWEVGMFGTDDFRAAIKPLLRWVRIEANDILTVCQGRRLQCDSITTHTEAHRMIMAMGAVKEGPPMRRFGKGDLDYQRFVWLAGENDAVLRPHYVREKEAA